MSLLLLAAVDVGSRTASCCAALTSFVASGCSGASTTYVAPASVSTRVVKTRDGFVRVALDGEVDHRAFAATDPVVLLHLRVGPVELGEIVVEAIGVLGDPKHPLAERHALDRVAAALALAVDDLFVREHGAERRAPVHGRSRAWYASPRLKSWRKIHCVHFT